MRRFLLGLYIGTVLLGGSGANALAQDAQTTGLTRVPLGTPIMATPGQEFYAQADPEPTPAVRLDRQFKSSMPGSVGFPFAFAIDTNVLVRVYTSPSGWDYFIPPDHKFRAWHSLLGSVIRDRDTVGLRVGPAGQMEWFVDNSIYARRPTLWTRPIKPGDPVVTRTNVGVLSEGCVERLIYLGLSRERRAMIRLEKVTPRKTKREEFSFPVDHNGRGTGAINGAEFAIEATPTQALITVVKAMTSDLGEVVRSPIKSPLPSSPET